MHEVDYLVVGSGATAMAFVDTMLTETDATFAMVDRRHVPGGHWNDAYPFVRLHQPSQYYGVASRPLGRGRKDASGLNRGFYELASGIEVTAYFHDVMDDVFLPSGRVSYHPSSEFTAPNGRPGGDGGSASNEGEVISLLSGERAELRWTTLVDATVLTTEIPLTHDRPFEVADGVTCEPPNHLARLAPNHAAVVIVGGGKTAIDCVTWLLGHGYPPERITWVVPRDSWLVNRSSVQPGHENFLSTVGGLAAQAEACATATTVDELCAQQDASGVWLRLDPDVWPEMFHAATISEHELAEIRRIGDIVRLGHVQRIEPDRLILTGGEVAVPTGALHVDCTASAAASNVGVRLPVFADGVITLQMVRPFQPCFSAALLGRVEATVSPEAKAGLARPTPMTDTVVDWLTAQADGMLNAGAWSQEPSIAGWLDSCRLNAIGHLLNGVDPDDAAKQALLGRMLTASFASVENLQRLAAEAAGSGS
ncbi:MAG: NAD(P)/FAD-dependent oxidoreductase [Actinomycetota bacterium]